MRHERGSSRAKEEERLDSTWSSRQGRQKPKQIKTARPVLASRASRAGRTRKPPSNSYNPKGSGRSSRKDLFPPRSNLSSRPVTSQGTFSGSGRPQTVQAAAQQNSVGETGDSWGFSRMNEEGEEHVSMSPRGSQGGILQDDQRRELLAAN
jgi:hypothetical protein